MFPVKYLDYQFLKDYTLTNIIMHELWTSRNKFEKDNILPNIERSVKTINSKLKYIIDVRYKH